jgi:hypothetical protein
VGALAVCLATWRAWLPTPARRAVQSLRGYRGIPDCPPTATADVLASDALECWFYGTDGAWRLLTVVSAHHALVVEAEVTGEAVVDEMANLVIGSRASDFAEVLIYASPIARDRSRSGTQVPGTVTRLRWTPGDGLSRLVFQRPRNAFPTR